EVLYGERDPAGRSHYDRVRDYYRLHATSDPIISRFYDARANRLTSLFYKADRAMRESGFDPSGRFGPFGAATLDYNPVDLNCLLYRTEMDMAGMLTLLDRTREAQVWMDRAERRAALINRLMWNRETGLYFDYDFERMRQSGYRFITTFYPLWAGLAPSEYA